MSGTTASSEKAIRVLVAIALSLSSCKRAVTYANEGDQNGARLVTKELRRSTYQVLYISELDWSQMMKPIATVFAASPSIPIPPSGHTHLLRLMHSDQTARELLKDQVSPIDVLTNNKIASSTYGTNLIVQTRYGLRYLGRLPMRTTETRPSETHQGQIICALAEAGLPFNYPILCGSAGSGHTIEHVINDALATFSLAQEELPWTTIALALYLRGTETWTSHLGERFSFERVAQHIMDQGYGSGSCAGTHNLYALVALANLDERAPVFKELMRRSVHACLRGVLQTLKATQNNDGSWDEQWFADSAGRSSSRTSTSESVKGSLIVTGHITETLLYLPKQLEPDMILMKNAATWLWNELSRPRAPNQVRKNFCPLIHAACAVSALRI